MNDRKHKSKMLWTLLFVCLATTARADILIFINNQQCQGTLTFIGDKFIEFKTEQNPGKYEWIQVFKKDLLAVVSNEGKIIYPRDKYDENAMNFRKIKLRNAKEAELYKKRKTINKQSQIDYENKEKNKYKVAVFVVSFGSLMLLTFLNNSV